MKDNVWLNGSAASPQCVLTMRVLQGLLPRAAVRQRQAHAADSVPLLGSSTRRHWPRTCQVSPVELPAKVVLTQCGDDAQLLGHGAVHQAAGDVHVGGDAVLGAVTTLTPACSSATQRFRCRVSVSQQAVCAFARCALCARPAGASVPTSAVAAAVHMVPVSV